MLRFKTELIVEIKPKVSKIKMQVMLLQGAEVW